MADWRQGLRQFFEEETAKAAKQQETLAQTGSEGEDWILGVARPALQEVARELEGYGFTARVNAHGLNASLTVAGQQVQRKDFRFSVIVTAQPGRSFAEYEVRYGGTTGRRSLHSATGPSTRVTEVAPEDVIREAVDAFKSFMHSKPV